MTEPDVKKGDKILIDAEEFGGLLVELDNYGYSVIGPTIRDGAIVYDEIESFDDLPRGFTDEQDGGYYRLKKKK